MSDEKAFPVGNAEEPAVSKCKAPQSVEKRRKTAILWSICAVFWTFLAVYGQHRSKLMWVVAALYWVVAAMWIRKAFRPSA